MTRLAPSQKKQFVEQLLAWYKKHQRKLPWRTTRDPYSIWVAEIMLQQTRISQAVRYYERFLEKFPTVEHLARAPLDQVLKIWEGLGYYARARHLHQAAQIVLRNFQGKIPERKGDLLQLPGIGKYTAGALLSIAFGQDEIVLDGNVRRVLCRVFGVLEDPRRPHVERSLERALRILLPRAQAGIFNQALMELGGRICLPKAPNCPLCPIENLCEAKRLGWQNQLPVRSSRRPRPHYRAAIGLIWKDGRLLIAQRPPEGLLGGLWEFPGGKRQPNETLEECLRREIREGLGIEIEIRKRLTTLAHEYSHFRVTLHAFECSWRSGRPRPLLHRAWAWVTLAQLEDFAFPRAHQKLIKMLPAREGLDPY